MPKLVSIFVLLAGVLMGQNNAASPGNAENGKRLFLTDGCYECHGTVGQGGTGPRLAPRPLALAALMSYIRKPAGAMPPYSSKIMPDSEVADVRAYLAAIPEPPPVKNIPLLNQ
jgi:ubiquinol-cytochrome c reductase cytochrome c subunit